MLMNTGEQPVFAQNGLVTTIAWGLDGQVTLRAGRLHFRGRCSHPMAAGRAEAAGGQPRTPSTWLGKVHGHQRLLRGARPSPGLGAPHWDQYARGTIVGLTRGCNKYHIIRATLDSLCYQVNDVLHAMECGLRHPD